MNDMTECTELALMSSLDKYPPSCEGCLESLTLRPKVRERLENT